MDAGAGFGSRRVRSRGRRYEELDEVNSATECGHGGLRPFGDPAGTVCSGAKVKMRDRPDSAAASNVLSQDR
jgi:hypothetical protein